jgi:hypothetical protein
MQYKAPAPRQDTVHHTILRPDPLPIHRVTQIAMPEGGSTLWFILAALAAMGWAASKRYGVRAAGNGKRLLR